VAHRLSGRGARSAVAVAAGVALLSVPQAAHASTSELAPKRLVLTVDQAHRSRPRPAAGFATHFARGNGISYHGGPLLTGRPNAYVIWYGDWSANTATDIIPAFLSSVGGSAYFNINTTYTNGGGVHVSNAVSFAGALTVGEYLPDRASLTDSDIQQIVADAVGGRLPAATPATGHQSPMPKDPNGVYFVLTSHDVAETSGFLTQYCGWHANASIGGRDLKFAFVGDPSANIGACAAQTTVSPNGNPAADAMVSLVAHELEETVTDPDLNAWYDTRYYENADKCAWTYGTVRQLSSPQASSNGSYYNMTIGSKPYLIQRNWVNNWGGYCALSS